MARQNRGKVLIGSIADGWKISPGLLVITGHLDEVEARVAPGLDAARADAVRDALVRRGVDPSAITVRADAFNHPMVQAAGPEVQNRYVTMTLPEADAGRASTPGLIR